LFQSPSAAPDDISWSFPNLEKDEAMLDRENAELQVPMLAVKRIGRSSPKRLRMVLDGNLHRIAI
jgi:hypothetical protein